MREDCAEIVFLCHSKKNPPKAENVSEVFSRNPIRVIDINIWWTLVRSNFSSDDMNFIPITCKARDNLLLVAEDTICFIHGIIQE